MNCYDSEGRLSGQCLQAVLQTVAEGILVCDPDLSIRFVNRSMEFLTGYSAKELSGRNARDIIICQAEIDLSRPSDSIECSVRRADGRTVPVLRNTRPIIDPNGDYSGAVASFSDISALRRAQDRLAELETISRKSEHFEGIVGKSKLMIEIFSLIDLASASNATVLITGETGTGKELAARAIHTRGPRQDKPFVTVNCSALPETLLESELFGHVKGAFTSAIREKPGRFELADEGTLFLDEIGELSPFIQVKLLRFLQSREFERVGESVTRRADVRIIVATNRSLRDLVNDGRFRDDLFYRLKVFPIHIPPLRERKEDIGYLVRYFINKFNEATGKSLTGLTHDAAMTLMDYCWPGNIRELENAIEHAFVTCAQGEIGLFDLPLEIRQVELRQDICSTGHRHGIVPAFASHPPVPARAIDGQSVLSALRDTGNNRAAAARALGIDRTTLWRKMKKFGSKKAVPDSHAP